MTLNLYKDCEAEASIVYSPAANTVGSFVANFTSITGSTLNTGVYKVELVVKNVSGTIYKDSLCKYLDCDDTKCTVVSNFLTDTDKMLAYNALVIANDCPQCSCQDMCTLNSILTSTTNDECQCGCCNS